MNRRHIAKLVSLTAISALTLGAAACGSSTDAVANDTELTYWSMWKQGEPQQVAIEASLAEFTKQTGIKVNVQWQGRDVLTKLQRTLTTTPAADLIDRNLAQVKSLMVSTGTAADLSGLLGTTITGESTTIGDVLPEKYRQLGTADGKLVMLPYQVVAAGFWYNSAQITDLPSLESWDAFQAVLDKRKAEGKVPLSLDADIPDYNAYWYTSLAVAKLGAGSFHTAAGDKTGAAWDDPGFLTAADQVSKLATGGYFIKGYDASKFPAIQQKWAANAADFVLMGSWLPSETSSYAASGFEYGFTPVPGSPVASNAYGWVIPSKAQHKTAAEKLIAFMYGKTRMQAFADGTKTISAREDVTPATAVSGAAEALKAKGSYPVYDAVNEDYADWWTKTFEPLNDKLITGQLDGAAFVAELKKQSIDYWKRNQ